MRGDAIGWYDSRWGQLWGLWGVSERNRLKPTRAVVVGGAHDGELMPIGRGPASDFLQAPDPEILEWNPGSLDEAKPFNVSTYKLVPCVLHRMAEPVYKWELYSNAQGGRVAP